MNAILDADPPDVFGEDDFENSEVSADGSVDDDKEVEVQTVLALAVGRSCGCDVAPQSTLSGACKLVAERLRASPEPSRSDPNLKDSIVSSLVHHLMFEMTG